MKSVLCLIFILVLLLSASACGGDPSTNSTESVDMYEEGAADTLDIATSQDVDSESLENIESGTEETAGSDIGEGTAEDGEIEESQIEENNSRESNKKQNNKREENGADIKKENGKEADYVGDEAENSIGKDYVEEYNGIEEDADDQDGKASSKEQNNKFSSKSSQYVSSTRPNGVVTSRPYQNSSTDRDTYTSYPRRDSSTVSQVNYPTKKRDIIVRRLNRSYFKTIGRCDTNAATGLDLNWSCSSIEFDLDCTEEIDLVFSRGNGSNPVFIEIYVDGKLIEPRTKIDVSGAFEKTIATGLNFGTHRVKIVRQSDCECPTLTLSKIRTYGSLVEKAPENNDLYIECIGDASLIGWGARLEDAFFTDFSQNIQEKQPIARNKEYQDSTLAYPYVAAQKLGADTYILARQGVGIAATWHKTSKFVDGKSVVIGNAKVGMLPNMYEYASISGSVRYTQTRTPDVIVLDVGSADVNSSCLSIVYDNEKVGINIERAAEISKEFLKSLKDKNPDAKIIWSYGLTGASEKQVNYIEGIVNDLGGEANGFYTVKIPTSERSGYPSVNEHEAAANILASKIQQITK